MALPSSPPLLPDLDEEVDLPSSPPPLPSSSFHLPALPNRKRPLPEHDNNLSSDPLFSEDPSEAEDQTEYERPKRKRMLKGPWWTPGRRTSKHAKDDVRNADSGVWFGSDGSDESIDSLLNTARYLNVRERVPTSTTAVPSSSMPAGERIARQRIDECVETGREDVDLSGLNLTHISPDMLNPLHSLIRQTHGTLTEPPSEDEFVALTPSIQLYLYRNLLTSLPAELFFLENLAVLSIRSNEISEIPHAIGRLRNLKELHVWGNQIRCLPWELLHLLQHREAHNQINVRPNPLVEPTKIEGPSPLTGLKVQVDADDLSRWGDTREYYETMRSAYLEHGPLDMRAEMELRLKLGRLLRMQYLQEASRAGTELKIGQEELIYLASSAVRIFAVDGTPLQKLRRDDEAHRAVVDPLSHGLNALDRSLAPSLFELALKCVQKHYNLHELPTGIPPTVKVAFEAAARGVEFGNQTCWTCNRTFIIPRAEWIEYWHYGLPSQIELEREKVFPFLRRACSWRCATPTPIGTFKC